MKQELSQWLLEGRYSLHQALFSDALEDRALHTFACDCATRAILCEKQYNRNVAEILVETIGIKRDWIDGQRSLAVMERARDKALFAINETNRKKSINSYSHYGYDPGGSGLVGLSLAHATQSAVWAISLDGEDAAENAALEACEAIVFARGTTREQERAWQCRRLAFVHKLAMVTRRMWLALDDECPLPFERPDEIALHAFDG